MRKLITIALITMMSVTTHASDDDYYTVPRDYDHTIDEVARWRGPGIAHFCERSTMNYRGFAGASVISKCLGDYVGPTQVIFCKDNDECHADGNRPISLDAGKGFDQYYLIPNDWLLAYDDGFYMAQNEVAMRWQMDQDRQELAKAVGVEYEIYNMQCTSDLSACTIDGVLYDVEQIKREGLVPVYSHMDERVDIKLMGGHCEGRLCYDGFNNVIGIRE